MIPMSKLKTASTLLAILSALTANAGAHTHDPNEAHGVKEAYYLAEHGDFGIGFEERQLNFHMHLHTGAIVDGNALEEDAAFNSDGLTIVVTHEAAVLRPVGQAWDSTGVDANEPLWVLPQHEKESLPALGLATEDIPIGVFADDMVTLNLRHLKGPGDFSVWTDDAFGLPVFLLSTHDQRLSTTLPVGLHSHCNWGFTQPGIYAAVFEATGNLTTGGSVRTWAILTFLVTEKPVPLEALPGDVNGDGVVDETDLALVEDNLGRTVPMWPSPERE